jgi:GTPase Era involved in 16S rRNA processing
LISQAKKREWIYNPSLVSEKSPVERAEEAMKQAIMEKYFEELPYQIGSKVVAWVPKINGTLRVDF